MKLASILFAALFAFATHAEEPAAHEAMPKEEAVKDMPKEGAAATTAGDAHEKPMKKGAKKTKKH